MCIIYNILTCILGGIVHSSHPGALFTAVCFHHACVENTSQLEFTVVPQDVCINVIIYAHLLCKW